VLSCTTDWLSLTGSGELEFEEFVTLAARFLVEEDAEAMQQELREAFRLYDKEGKIVDSTLVLHYYIWICCAKYNKIYVQNWLLCGECAR